MTVLDIGGIPTSLGEIINIKYHLDLIKHQYSQIKLSFHKQLWNDGLHMNTPDWPEKKKLWDKYLNDIGQLFFSEKPYVLLPQSNRFGGDAQDLLKKLRMMPQKAEMGHLLCKGSSLNLEEEYIVITTKVRYIKKTIVLPKLIELWSVVRKLASKYKIVILGEREVEMRKEYIIDKDSIFGIYDHIISNLPTDRILDLTVPALGETVSDFSQVQQDCLIMKEAKFVITVGIGGNFCMATSVGNVIGYRADNLQFANIIFRDREYPNCIITEDWNYFISVLGRHL